MTITRLVHGQATAERLAIELIRASKWFTLEPRPDDDWSFEVKDEANAAIRAYDLRASLKSAAKRAGVEVCDHDGRADRDAAAALANTGKRIVEAAQALLDFHDTYVAVVADTTGHDLTETGSGEWVEVTEDLREALKGQ